MNTNQIETLPLAADSRPLVPTHADDPTQSYDRSRLTYAETFGTARQQRCIRMIELLTAKPQIYRMVREFEERGPAKGQDFWAQMLDVMGIACETPADQISNIPTSGPTVVVANHPHGLVDGLLLAHMIGQRRSDYLILTRSVLIGIDEEASKHLIAVPFPHQHGAQKKMIEMRARAMDHLARGGIVALFPSGVVASSDTLFGPVIEREWNVFTSKMIRKSCAAVVPIRFTGSNSRSYQIANRVSATVRQGLLLREIVHACGKAQSPVIGPAISRNEIQARINSPREFAAWLRAQVLGLGT